MIISGATWPHSETSVMIMCVFVLLSIPKLKIAKHTYWYEVSDIQYYHVVAIENLYTRYIY